VDPDYTVIIPAYNEQALLPRTLSLLAEAMKAQTVAGEVIVVDNNSTDDTAAAARRAGARVVHEPVNQISRARNAGARAATADRLLFLDADTMPTPALIGAALGRLDRGSAGGGAFIELGGDGPASFAHRLLPLLSWVLMKAGICGGSFMFCRRDAFTALGGFSVKVFAGEDALMSRALKGWAKRNGRSFDILTDTPIRSSDRKLHMHSPVTLSLYLLMFAFFPFVVRYKRFCRLWYHRPANGKI